MYGITLTLWARFLVAMLKIFPWQLRLVHGSRFWI
eukprot:SAG11_NODE_12228_length_714_cov_1.551220_1_plen_34_part_10